HCLIVNLYRRSALGNQPRPTNGILVAITVRNWMLASGVTVAQSTTERATFSTSIVGSIMISPLGCGTPRVIRCVISVSALPTSIWLQEMSYLRPSSEVDFVRPVTACLAVESAIDCGRGTCAEIEPLLMMRPPIGFWSFM